MSKESGKATGEPDRDARFEAKDLTDEDINFLDQDLDEVYGKLIAIAEFPTEWDRDGNPKAELGTVGCWAFNSDYEISRDVNNEETLGVSVWITYDEEKQLQITRYFEDKGNNYKWEVMLGSPPDPAEMETGESYYVGIGYQRVPEISKDVILASDFPRRRDFGELKAALMQISLQYP